MIILKNSTIIKTYDRQNLETVLLTKYVLQNLPLNVYVAKV